MLAHSGCFQRLLCTGFALAAIAVAEATELFTFDQFFDASQLTTRGVTIALADGALDIKGAMPASDNGVVFPLPEQAQDLSRFRFVEADFENTGDKPLRFTFWARSGHGWGGVSTFTPDGGPTAGRETLAAGQRGTLKIDLHTRYPGKDVYTPATNPASVRWLELVVGDSRIAPSLRVRSLRATGDAPAERPDDPGPPWKPVDGAGWHKVGLGWDERAARLRGRPWFAAPANLGAHVHVDVECLEDRPSTVATRRWLHGSLVRH